MVRFAWLLPLTLALGLVLHYGAERFLPDSKADRLRRQRSQRGARRAGEPRHVGPVTLRGPGGELALPQDHPLVVNVWLQGCADCMPRFRAAQHLALNGEDWPKPVVNVAYGRADPAWAERYGVGEQLVFDPGSALVRPLGIGTFTTLVIDAHGYVRHTDYVEREGFRERVMAALKESERPWDVGASSPPQPEAAPTPAPTRVREEIKPPSQDVRVLGALALAFLAGMIRIGSGAGSRPSRDEGSWREELVAGGRRCHHCAGRFQDVDELTRCRGCRTPYHEVCAEKAEVCNNLDCARYMKSL